MSGKKEKWSIEEEEEAYEDDLADDYGMLVRTQFAATRCVDQLGMLSGVAEADLEIFKLNNGKIRLPRTLKEYVADMQDISYRLSMALRKERGLRLELARRLAMQEADSIWEECEPDVPEAFKDLSKAVATDDVQGIIDAARAIKGEGSSW